MTTIYTHDDLDGWCAAAVLLLKGLPGEADGPVMVKYVQYGDPAPPTSEIEGRDVYVLDFSWPIKDMAALADTAVEFVWLDHHRTAVERYKDSMKGREWNCSEFGWLWRKYNVDVRMSEDNTQAGCMLAWDYRFGSVLDPKKGPPPPHALRAVDRCDRWDDASDEDRRLVAALNLLAATGGKAEWPGWGALLSPAIEFVDMGELGRLGAHLISARDLRIAGALKRAVPVTLDGHPCRCCNHAVSEDTSELGHRLALEADPEGRGIGWVWSLGADKGGHPIVVNSLRSGPDGPDVSAIAKERGGGGHEHAAGWEETRPISWTGECGPVVDTEVLTAIATSKD